MGGTDRGKGNPGGQHCGIHAAELRAGAENLVDESVEQVGVAFIRLDGELFPGIAGAGGCFAGGALAIEPIENPVGRRHATAVQADQLVRLAGRRAGNARRRDG